MKGGLRTNRMRPALRKKIAAAAPAPTAMAAAILKAGLQNDLPFASFQHLEMFHAMRVLTSFG